jgi:hypothetical protein
VSGPASGGAFVVVGDTADDLVARRLRSRSRRPLKRVGADSETTGVGVMMLVELWAGALFTPTNKNVLRPSAGTMPAKNSERMLHLLW